jgi:hypothetical protein
VTAHPIWTLVPWAVFAMAAGIKFWRVTSLFRRHLQNPPSTTERFRRKLERIWQQDQQTTA